MFNNINYNVTLILVTAINIDYSVVENTHYHFVTVHNTIIPQVLNIFDCIILYFFEENQFRRFIQNCFCCVGYTIA